jgi:hypothetical protein
VKPEFVIKRQGKDFILYAGLLDAAHAGGLKALETRLLQAPSKENGDTAIVQAVASFGDGRMFGGIGDANPGNVGPNIRAHAIRMAETRAKARALRDALNIGAAALEELGDDDEPPAPVRKAVSEPAQAATKARVPYDPAIYFDDDRPAVGGLKAMLQDAPALPGVELPPAGDVVWYPVEKESPTVKAVALPGPKGVYSADELRAFRDAGTAPANLASAVLRFSEDVREHTGKALNVPKASGTELLLWLLDMTVRWESSEKNPRHPKAPAV